VGIAAGTMTTSALALVPALPFAVPGHGPGLDTVGAMLVLGFGATGLGFLVYYILIADLGPARASIVAYLAPGFSVVYGAALLGERVGPGTVAGLALILGGSYLGVQGRLPVRARLRV
jgi:drug/metabolite transporter (DMT)-like permease